MQVDGGCGSSRQITCQTLKRTLIDFGVMLCDKDLEQLCAFLDRCGDGQIVVGDLFDLIRPKLSQTRADLIEAAYRGIDTDDDGCISIADVMVDTAVITYYFYSISFVSMLHVHLMYAIKNVLLTMDRQCGTVCQQQHCETVACRYNDD